VTSKGNKALTVNNAKEQCLRKQAWKQGQMLHRDGVG
jgi:hypothetical protein